MNGRGTGTIRVPAIDRLRAMCADPDENGCILWLGRCDGGYGRLKVRGRMVMAHRLAYELAIGPVPDGLVLDHVWERGCRSTRCVNPAHLEPVTNLENMRRSAVLRTACPHGHPFTPENTRTNRGYRECKTCKYAYKRRRRSKIATANATASGDTEERALAHHPQQALAVAHDPKDPA